MTDNAITAVLTVNAGSSSLKTGVYAPAPGVRVLFTAQADRLGRAASHLRIRDERGEALLDEDRELPSQEAALDAFVQWLGNAQPAIDLVAIGHRLVHGGMAFSAPVQITPDVLATLKALVPLAPDHLPAALAGIAASMRAHPGLPQVACFDTAFHRTMPRLAQLFALPRRLADEGVVRYGFHGLSYEYVMSVLGKDGDRVAAGRIIIAHLGNGASMAAVRDGVGIDTTMGFTPDGGLMMGTRAGDLDPGILLYLLQQRGMAPDAVSELVRKQAGLLGVSGTSSDMQDLLAHAAGDPHAAEAIDLFCYQARKFVGALTAVLGGLDTLVFTGGIGEHAAPVREHICAGLDYLGIRLDRGRNAAHAPVISAEGSVVSVRVLPTDEDLMIARHTCRLLQLQLERQP